jgi:hypothetical protein
MSAWRVIATLVLLTCQLARPACRAQGGSSKTLRFGVLPFAGRGGFPRSPDTESGATRAGRLLIGAALDVPSTPRFVLLASIARGLQPAACAGGCAPDGTITGAGLLWVATPPVAKSGVLLGPSVEHTTFDGNRVGFGATLSAGALRGWGPRLLVGYHALTGFRHPSSVMGVLAVRLGG